MNKRCKFPSCGRKPYAHDYCQAHYKQKWAGKPLSPLVRENLVLPDGRIFFPMRAAGRGSGRVTTYRAESDDTIHRVCGVCKAMLPIETFKKWTYDANFGRHYRCPPCIAEAGIQRASYLLRKFGMTKADYDAMAKRQGQKCLICKRRSKKRRLSVDHDHATGKVRGLLCSRCNTMLGHAGDDPAILEAGVAYLRRDYAQPGIVA